MLQYINISLVFSIGKEMVVMTGLRSVEGLAIDWISKNLYFTDNALRSITVVRLENIGHKRTIITHLGNPRAIVVDPNVGFVSCLLISMSGADA